MFMFCPFSGEKYLFLFGLVYLKISYQPRSNNTFRKLRGNQAHIKTTTTDTSRYVVFYNIKNTLLIY